MAQNDPLDSSSQKNWPGGQQDKGPEVVLHVQEEVYQSTLTLKRRVAGDQEWFWFVSLSHPSSVLTWIQSRTKYQSLGLTLLNARSSIFSCVQGCSQIKYLRKVWNWVCAAVWWWKIKHLKPLESLFLNRTQNCYLCDVWPGTTWGNIFKGDKHWRISLVVKVLRIVKKQVLNKENGCISVMLIT